MSHELNYNAETGTATMARTADVSCWWEGMRDENGRVLRSNIIDPETMTREEMLQAGGIDFTVEQRAVFYGVLDPETGKKKAMVIPNRLAQVHSKTQACLGIVSENRYNITQPYESFDAITSASTEGTQNNFGMRTLGALKGGREWWCMAKANRTIDVDGTNIEPNLVWRSGAWGVATAAVLTAVDVVCKNTLQLALDGGAIRIPHSVKITEDIVKATLERLGAIEASLDTFEENLDTLIHTPMTRDDAVKFYVDQFAEMDAETGKLDQRKLDKIMKPLMESYVKSPGQELSCRQDNAWGVLSGLTHFVDHSKRAHSAENRFINSTWGKDAGLKQKAFQGLLKASRNEAPLASQTGEEFAAQYLQGPVTRAVTPQHGVSEFDALLNQ